VSAVWDRVVDAICRALCTVFFWRFRVIPKARDPRTPLLRQLLLWKSRRLEIYLQHFDNPEDPFWFHCHEWPRMRSFVLSGGYTEERVDQLPSERLGYIVERYRGNIDHNRLTTYTMDRTAWHRTHAWGDHCWTLFVCRGGRVIPRGYREVEADSSGARLGPFVPWREHIVKRVPSLTGIETP
jgi:hypothetical protein